MTSEMSILVSFPDQSESFVLGFEAGQIWQEIDGEGKPEIDRGMDEGIPIHAANIEVIRRMASARNYQVQCGQEVDGWLPIKLVWQENPKPSLKVVPNE